MNALHLLPAKIAQQIESDPEGHAPFLNRVAGYQAMKDDDLVRVTEVCLKNLERLDRDGWGPDADLRQVLIPELWERILPGAHLRDRLRQISTTMAEYRPDPDRPSFFRHASGGAERLDQLRSDAEDLRVKIAQVAAGDAAALAEQVRFAIAGSIVAQRFAPTQFVYEPAFTYCLAPVVTLRYLTRTR